MNAAYLNGHYLPLEQIRVAAMDRGFLFGDGIYELIPVYNGKIFWFAEHYARMERGLSEIGISNPHTQRDWFDICQNLVNNSDTKTLSIYIQITRGVEWVRNHFYDPQTPPTAFAYVTPMQLRTVEEIPAGSAISLEDTRWLRCDIKSTNLLPNIMARQKAHAQGANEAILIRNGYALEGASSNLFMVKDNKVLTAPNSNLILPGITREVVLSIMQQHGIDYEERPFTLAELYQADEVWISSSIRELQPIVKIDDHKIKEGKPGPIWQKLITLFYELKAKLENN